MWIHKLVVSTSTFKVPSTYRSIWREILQILVWGPSASPIVNSVHTHGVSLCYKRNTTIISAEAIYLIHSFLLQLHVWTNSAVYNATEHQPYLNEDNVLPLKNYKTQFNLYNTRNKMHLLSFHRHSRCAFAFWRLYLQIIQLSYNSR